MFLFVILFSLRFSFWIYHWSPCARAPQGEFCPYYIGNGLCATIVGKFSSSQGWAKAYASPRWRKGLCFNPNIFLYIPAASVYHALYLDPHAICGDSSQVYLFLTRPIKFGGATFYPITTRCDPILSMMWYLWFPQHPTASLHMRTM